MKIWFAMGFAFLGMWAQMYGLIILHEVDSRISKGVCLIVAGTILHRMLFYQRKSQ